MKLITYINRIIIWITLVLLPIQALAADPATIHALIYGGATYFDPNTCTATAPTTGNSAETLKIMLALPIREKIGQLLMAETGTKDEAVQLETKFQLGGIFLPGGATSLYNKAATDAVQKAGKVPTLISVDQEGGKVARLSGVIGAYPSAKVLGNMPIADIKRIATEEATKMKALGINVDLAPVVDIDDGKNAAIASFDRSFSTDYAKIAVRAGAFASGLRDGGVVPTLKHFPGIGTSKGNSDLERSITRPLSTLQTEDLVPYTTLAKESPTIIMMGNLVVPGLTAGKTPEQTSLNKDAVNLLRNQYGFGQVIMTDEIANAKSVSYQYAPPEAVSLAIQAGVDMPLFSRNPKYPTMDAQLTAIVDKVEADIKAGKITEAQINQSLERIAKIKVSSPNSAATTTPTNPAGAPSTASPAGAPGKIYVIGNSLTLGMYKAGLKTRLEADGNTVLQIQNTVGISIPGSLPRLASDGARVRQAEKIIIELGTNDSRGATDAGITQKVKSFIDAVKSLNSSAKIYWVNLYSNKFSVDAANAAINKNAGSLNYEVIDWTKEAATPGKYIFDSALGVHPNQYDKMATFVAEWLKKGASTPTPSPIDSAPGSCGPCPIGPIGGTPITGSNPSVIQEGNAKIIIGIAKTENLPQSAALIGLMVGLAESGLKNYANSGVPISLTHPNVQAVGHDHDSVGVMQQRPSTGWSTFPGSINSKDVVYQLMDPAYAAEAFFGSPPGTKTFSALRKGLQNVSSWQTLAPWVVAQKVQASGTASGSNYQRQMPQAQALISKLWDLSPPIPLPVPFTAATGTNTGGGSGGASATTDCSGTGGGQTAPVSTNGCVNPLSDPAWGLARTDQGVDFIPNKPLPVLAICDGQILSGPGSRWPGGTFMLIKLSSGPFSGKCMYVAEHLTNMLPVGTKVMAGQTIATALPGNPWTEWGWAAGPGTPSVRYGGSPNGTPMPGGKAFARFLRSLGAKTRQDPGPGPLYDGASCQ